MTTYQPGEILLVRFPYVSGARQPRFHPPL